MVLVTAHVKVTSSWGVSSRGHPHADTDMSAIKTGMSLLPFRFGHLGLSSLPALSFVPFQACIISPLRFLIAQQHTLRGLFTVSLAPAVSERSTAFLSHLVPSISSFPRPYTAAYTFWYPYYLYELKKRYHESWRSVSFSHERSQIEDDSGKLL